LTEDAVLERAFPDHDESAKGVRRDRRSALVARGVGVDQKLGAERRAGTVVALAEDAVADTNSLVQTTTKFPDASTDTREAYWSRRVCVFTRNSEPSGTPEPEKRWP
jgi:hypothetical protein